MLLLGFAIIREIKTKSEETSTVIDFVILFNLHGDSVATKAPARNSHEREVGEKNEAVG